LEKNLDTVLKKFKNSPTPPLFVCVMNDSYIFFADSIRKVNQDLHCEFLFIEERDGQSPSISDQLQKFDLKNKNVVFVSREIVPEFSEITKFSMELGAATAQIFTA
jgi:hypoxanthine-guanine phosphoribosyltransferase